MQSGGGGLKLHTTITPETARATNARAENVKWRVRPRAHRALTARRPRIRQKRGHVKRKTTRSERLLRNTAVACAMLLTLMALSNIDTPFTNRVTTTMRNLLSMDMKLDESLGKLSFVKRLVPESALVFLNIAPAAPALPVEGELAHAYSEAQPWQEYLTHDNASARAIKGGTVAACAQSGFGDWTVLVNHADGSQAVYAYLTEAVKRAGEYVERGDAVGVTGAGERARLYLEYREQALPADPAPIIRGENN